MQTLGSDLVISYCLEYIGKMGEKVSLETLKKREKKGSETSCSENKHLVHTHNPFSQAFGAASFQGGSTLARVHSEPCCPWIALFALILTEEQLTFENVLPRCVQLLSFECVTFDTHCHLHRGIS